MEISRSAELSPAAVALVLGGVYRELRLAASVQHFTDPVMLFLQQIPSNTELSVLPD